MTTPDTAMTERSTLIDQVVADHARNSDNVRLVEEQKTDE